MLLMCAAQLSKIVCYNPNLPYLVLIPTVLLSAGMLMFFTLGASMVGDICDEDELHTGTRSEGSYYSVYWWFIKMGTAFASFVTGALLVLTHFDEKQNVAVDDLHGSIAVIKVDAESWMTNESPVDDRQAAMAEHLDKATDHLARLRSRLQLRSQDTIAESEELATLLRQIDQVSERLEAMRETRGELVGNSQELVVRTAKTLQEVAELKKQSPRTLFRLRFIEIGLPLGLSVISILLALRYPLNEARCHEIKLALRQRTEA